MSFLDKRKMAKSRARQILLVAVIFWIMVEWWIHWVDWPWYVEYPIGGYVTLNLIFQMWVFARRMRVLNSPFMYLEAIREACEEAIYPNDKCRGCGRWKGKGHLAQCVHNPEWK